ncbi:MAG: exodeoxyribonuclease V subunit gamma [Clostridia bacterium]|jgi:ATP-dependent helicase/nuclease subunit B|nr:exodeoxyribonuclease V subunit gamma [Clostridia bacterium]
MSLRFIIGKTGYGKSYTCINEIVNSSSKEPLIYLVPEQYTLENQIKLSEKMSSGGILTREVLSFKRLAYKILDELGEENINVLGEIGEVVYLSKVINKNKDNFSYYGKSVNKFGFVESIKDMINEFYKYDIHEEELNKIIENTGNDSLRVKAKDFKMIHDAFKLEIDGKYRLGEELLLAAVDKIMDSKKMEDAEIWIDGFYGYTPIEKKIISKLLRKVKRVNVTINADKKIIETDILNKYNPFYESKKTYMKLLKIAESNGVAVEKDVFLNNANMKNKEMKHLQENYLKYENIKYTGEIKNIKIYEAPNRYNEAEYVASNIFKLIKGDKYRFSDIAILTADLEGYKSIIKSKFDGMNFKYFIDENVKLEKSKITEYLLGILKFLDEGYKYNTVFNVVKNTYFNCKKDELDLLENYIIRYGINSKKRWNEEVIRNIKSNDDYENEFNMNNLDKIQIIKDDVVMKLDLISNTINKNNKVKQNTENLYGLIKDIDIENKNEVKVYNKIIDIFEKIVEIIGDEKLNKKEYIEIIKNTIMLSEIGVIPNTKDYITVGDVERTRIDNKKIVFIIGVNEGILPRRISENGLFSDKERDEIEGLDIEISKGGISKSFEENFLIYTAVAKPEEKMFLSYSIANINGESLRKSNVINKVIKMFDNIGIESDLFDERNYKLPFDDERTKTLYRIRNYIGDVKREKIKIDEISLYENDEKFNKALKAIGYTNKEKNIQRETNVLNSSVTRLEQYNQCPFKYFIEYDLRVKDRKEFELENLDIGLIIHRVIEEFSKKVVNRDMKWSDVSNEFIAEKVKDIFKNIKEEYNNKIFDSSNKNLYYLSGIKKIANSTVESAVDHIKKGSFSPLDFEIEFGQGKTFGEITFDINNGIKMKLNGKIDRVDILNKNEKAYIKIIDYKTGASKFSVNDLYNGEKLQLFVYMDAIMKLGNKIIGKEIVPAGVYYFKAQDPKVKTDTLENKTFGDIIKKEFKMSGITVDDKEIIKEIDPEFASGSEIIEVKLKKDGDYDTRSSSIIGIEDLGTLNEFVNEKVKSIGNNIVEGNIDISPIKKENSKACDYCKFKGICKFDERLDKYRDYTEKKTLTDILEEMKG